MMVGTETNTQLIADLQLLGAFPTLAVHFHFTGLDRLRSEGARFEKARGPQPFVEPDSRYVIGTHA